MGKGEANKGVIKKVDSLKDSLKKMQEALRGGVSDKDLARIERCIQEQISNLQKVADELGVEVERTTVHAVTLNDINNIALKFASLREHLQKALEQIVAISDMGIQPGKGVIQVWDPIFKRLETMASIGLSEKILRSCNISKNPQGCLCGEVAENNQLLLLGENNKEKCKLSKDSHYCGIPIQLEREKLGVLVLFREEGQKVDTEYFDEVANSLAVIILSSRERVISVLPKVQEMHLKINSFEDIQQAVYMISYMCPNSYNVGFGLYELITNALEHGVCLITFEDKSEWRKTKGLEDKWKSEFLERNAKSIQEGKFVDIFFNRYEDRIEIIIDDHGPGFSHKDYINPDYGRFGKHGHGLGLSNGVQCFDKVEFNEVGNRATLTILLNKEEPVIIDDQDE